MIHLIQWNIQINLYHLSGNLSSLPGAERGFSSVIMNLCHFSQVGFFQLEHSHSNLCSLFSMELLWAWSCSKDSEMKVATYPNNFCVQVRSHSSQERKPFLDQWYAARERNEREEKGDGKQIGELVGQVMGALKSKNSKLTGHIVLSEDGALPVKATI